MIEVAKGQSKVYSARVIFPCLCAVYMYRIRILLNNFSSETTCPVSTKFHAEPTVETGLRVCSNGQAPLTVMPIYGKQIIIIIIIIIIMIMIKHIRLIQCLTFKKQLLLQYVAYDMKLRRYK